MSERWGTRALESDSQAWRCCEFWIPVLEVALAVLLSLRDVEDLVLRASEKEVQPSTRRCTESSRLGRTM